MSQYITFIIILAVVIVGLVIAFLRIRKYSKKEKLHQQLSDHYGLRGSYVNEKKFKLLGYHRDYRFIIESYHLPQGTVTEIGGNSIKFSIPMINPLRKCLRILKNEPQHDEVANHIPLDKLLAVKHDLGDWLQMHTNDMVFSSLVLSENVRISIHNALQHLPYAAVIYIQDDEMGCIIPTLLSKESQLEGFYRIADALADMKDELN